jgi:hypothetical protein
VNIDDMQAGREMDALVAERVLGWSVDPGLYAETAFLYPPEWKSDGLPSAAIFAAVDAS